MNVVLTGGPVKDSKPILALFDGVELSGKKILADKAYSCLTLKIMERSAAFPIKPFSK